ncbi:citryl-CoA lyase [Allostella sp. ATCC 35155]|nr:citryl-CoA lyase [Stella sp. ATCC 35155]
MAEPRMKTWIATSDAASITVRGLDLVEEVIGRYGFTEMLYFNLAGRFPAAGEARILDACLVTLMEHGITPSSLIARLVTDSVPNQMQVAVAAGLTVVGDVFVGTMEGCAAILSRGIAAGGDADAFCRGVVAEHRAAGKRLPGFGHPFHKPDDPRTPRLFAFAREQGVAGHHIALLERLNIALDAAAGRHQTINATGAVAALLLEIGLPADMFRGVALVSRCGGLLAHVQEERREPSARHIWAVVEENMEYRDPD